MTEEILMQFFEKGHLGEFLCMLIWGGSDYHIRPFIGAVKQVDGHTVIESFIFERPLPCEEVELCEEGLFTLCGPEDNIAVLPISSNRDITDADFFDLCMDFCNSMGITTYKELMSTINTFYRSSANNKPQIDMREIYTTNMINLFCTYAETTNEELFDAEEVEEEYI